MSPPARGPALSRRDFLRVGAVTGGVLAIEVSMAGCVNRSPSGVVTRWREDPRAFVPGAWVKITPAGQVIVRLEAVEMGQGVMTSHVALVAEELEVDPARVQVEFAPAARVYDNTQLGFQATGGSTSVAVAWRRLRHAGATAREMLRMAAAGQWGVAPETCTARDGAIVHPPSQRRATYGQLTEAAARVGRPRQVRLKPPSQYRLIGQPLPRLDAPAKVTGTALFGLDVERPGLLTAVLVRSPVLEGRLQRFEAGAARAMPGVRHVVGVSRGVAVVADSYWQAKSAAALVEAHFDESASARSSSDHFRALFAERAGKSGKVVRRQGSLPKGMGRAHRVLEAVYEVPYLAHATMEPQNATAHVRADRCDIWAPTQSVGLAREVGAQLTGLSHDQVYVHQTFLGGGFGRRFAQDYVADAVEVSRAVGGLPVKVVYSREDDLANDYYRPASYSVLRGAIDARGMPVAWFHRIVSQSLIAHQARDFVAAAVPNSMAGFVKRLAGRSLARGFRGGLLTDPAAIEGAADLPYDIPHLRVEYAPLETGVPLGFWRSVGHSGNAFVVESFLDELCHAGGRDPYQLRRALLGGHPRHLAVLDRCATLAGWGQPLPAGVHRGIAVHKSFGSYCAQVAEVSVKGGQLKVHRVVCTIDCGIAINPDIVRAQMESGIVFGLSAGLKQTITFKGGRVQQGNFHQYPLLRMHEMPKIEVHVMPAHGEPTGCGEPGVPPIAPAVANALFRATGQRLRRLPIEPDLGKP